MSFSIISLAVLAPSAHVFVHPPSRTMSAIVIHPARPPSERSRLLPATPSPRRQAPGKQLSRSAPLKDTISPARFIVICAGIWSANFVFAFQASAIPTLAPSISSGFNHAELSSYLGGVFSLASAAGAWMSPLSRSRGMAELIAVLVRVCLGCRSHPDLWGFHGQSG